MSIHETRLNLAIDATAWSRQGATPAIAAQTFSLAHDTVVALGGSDDWAETVLRGAWELTRAAAPRGADVHAVLSALVTVHAALAAVDRPGQIRPRPRRDA
jgi:hypothetical protein